jgi:hypothetical protein
MEVRPPVPASRRAKRGQRPCNWSWGVGGEGMAAERPVPVASAARTGTRSVKSGQDPMKRETERAGRLPDWGRSPGQEAQSAKSGQDPMKRETERTGRPRIGGGLRAGGTIRKIRTRPYEAGDGAGGAGWLRAGVCPCWACGSARETPTGSYTEPATGRLSRWWRGGSDGADAGQGCVRGREVRIAKPRQDAIRSLPPGACPGGGTVRLDASGAGPGSALGQEARLATLGHDPIQREAARFDGADAGLRFVVGRKARPATLGHDPIQREAARFDGANAGRGSVVAQRHDLLRSLPAGYVPVVRTG